MKRHNVYYVKTICSSIYTCFILYPYLFNFHTPYCDNICIFYLITVKIEEGSVTSYPADHIYGSEYSVYKTLYNCSKSVFLT